jgi:hypothetical protein
MSTKDEDDMKHYKTGIRKWDGLRGESWRIFIRDVKAHARGRFSKDDKFNWGKVMTGIDAGGAAQGAPALPNGDAAQIKQDIRRGETYTFLYEHIACDKIKQMLQILADGPEPADGIGKAAWDLIVREGQEDENDLELEDLNEAWEAMSIMNTVGIRLTSVNDFRRSIDIMDGKRPANHRKDENAKARKLLHALIKEGPPSIVTLAAKELRAEGAGREHKKGANNDRDLDAMVCAFDNAWQSLYNVDPALKPRPPTKSTNTRINVLFHEDIETDSALVLDTEEQNEENIYLVKFADGEEVLYMHQSKTRGLKYGGVRKYASAEVTEDTLVGFSDSSFGPPYPHCGGFIEFNGAATDWFSRVHKFAPQSTWEAELAAINMLLKIMRFASHLYYDMTKKKLPTPWLFTDSKSAFDTIKNPGATKRSNHLERWLHFARELYLRNAIRYGLVPTHLMMADNLTKVADREKFFTCIQYQMGM